MALSGVVGSGGEKQEGVGSTSWRRCLRAGSSEVGGGLHPHLNPPGKQVWVAGHSLRGTSQAVEQLLADEGGDAHRGQASLFLGLQKLRQRTVLPANWRTELSPQEEGSRESLRHAPKSGTQLHWNVI